MGSHQDYDVQSTSKRDQEIREAFSKRAEELTTQQANLITAGHSDEPVLLEKDVDGILVRRLPKDPLAIRISIRRPYELSEGAYIVYRGDRDRVVELLEESLAALKKSD